MGTKLELSGLDSVSSWSTDGQVTPGRGCCRQIPSSPGALRDWELRRSPKNHLGRMAYLSYILP